LLLVVMFVIAVVGSLTGMRLSMVKPDAPNVSVEYPKVPEGPPQSEDQSRLVLRNAPGQPSTPLRWCPVDPVCGTFAVKSKYGWTVDE
jgi:hypothetical protein